MCPENIENTGFLQFSDVKMIELSKLKCQGEWFTVSPDAVYRARIGMISCSWSVSESADLQHRRGTAGRYIQTLFISGRTVWIASIRF